jgi:deoxyhypusine synthase
VDARTASISEETARATKIENNLQLHISRNLNDLTKKINTVDEKLIVDTTADANIEVYTKAQIDAMFTQLKQKNNLI